MRKLVYIETPYAPRDGRTLADHVEFARACMFDSLARGEAPFLSHLLYPQVLDDTDTDQRSTGIASGFAWAQHAELTVIYDDLGITPGMQAGLRDAIACGRPYEFRKLGV